MKLVQGPFNKFAELLTPTNNTLRLVFKYINVYRVEITLYNFTIVPLDRFYDKGCYFYRSFFTAHTGDIKNKVSEENKKSIRRNPKIIYIIMRKLYLHQI